MPIRNSIAEAHAELTALRQDIHRHPELLYETTRTAGVVAEALRRYGCDEVVEGIGRTGVVGVIRGNSDTAGRVVGLRADMDALPMSEQTGLPHASTRPGMMHACGHDGHTAMLLGAAQYLAATRRFDGTVVVIFQPAEEGGAGAAAMIADGLFERFGIQEVYGMHNRPGRPAGSFSIRAGAYYAATDSFTIDIVGKGGHAAKPHSTIDPTPIAAHVVLALQSIVSRTADPLKSLVVSVTSSRTETEAYNVIPERVELRGTVRSFDRDLRNLARERLHTIATHTALAHGAEAEIVWEDGYPAMINHEANTDFARAAAARVTGQPVEEAPAIMGGEDFAYMLEVCPGAYIQIGNGDSFGVHHPKYDFADEAIPFGASYWVELAEQRLPVG